MHAVTDLTKFQCHIAICALFLCVHAVLPWVVDIQAQSFNPEYDFLATPPPVKWGGRGW